MIPRTDDRSTLAQTGDSGEQTLTWSLVHRMFTRGHPWDQLLWKGVGRSRIGSREKWQCNQVPWSPFWPHRKLWSLNGPLNLPHVRLKWPGSLYSCLHLSLDVAHTGTVSSNEAALYTEANPKGRTAEGCLMTTLPAAGTSSFLKTFYREGKGYCMWRGPRKESGKSRNDVCQHTSFRH